MNHNHSLAECLLSSAHPPFESDDCGCDESDMCLYHKSSLRAKTEVMAITINGMLVFVIPSLIAGFLLRYVASVSEPAAYLFGIAYFLAVGFIASRWARVVYITGGKRVEQILSGFLKHLQEEKNEKSVQEGSAGN